MSRPGTSDAGLGSGFPGSGAQRVLRLLLPSGRRDELVGDLIEEAETVVLPSRGRDAALRWFWWQVFTSVSPMHARRCAREISMNRQRWIVVAAVLILGPLMAWDSNVFTAPAAVVALVAMAIAIPAAAGLLSGNLRVLAGAAFISTVLLLIGRWSSGVELRWYAMPWIFFLILYMNWAYEHRVSSSRGGGGPADSPSAS
jgi:hypothetical protein